MILLSGIVGVLLVLTAEAKVGQSSESEYCTETQECLLFKRVCKTDEYEVRVYSSAKWVSTKEKFWFMDYAMVKAFWRLYGYITGENQEGQNIEMTSPVLVGIPVTTLLERGVCTMSFLLPSAHQMNPPKPTDDAVYVHDMPEMTVYVKSYGGWLTAASDAFQAYRLAAALEKRGATYKKDHHYGVGYDSPMKLFDRHNEVWFVAEGEPVCSSSEELLLD